MKISKKSALSKNWKVLIFFEFFDILNVENEKEVVERTKIMTLHYEYEIPVSHYKRVTINKEFIEEVNKCLEYYIGENVVTIGEEYIKDLFLGQLTDEDEVYLQGTRWHGVQSLSNFVKSAVSDAIIDWYDYEEEEWGDVTHESWDLTE